MFLYDWIGWKAFGQNALLALLCIAVVFCVLALITLILSSLNRIKALDVKQETKTVTEPKDVQESKQFSSEDIEDEDMMVAVLVASIDYREECKTDVRVINAKRIG